MLGDGQAFTEGPTVNNDRRASLSKGLHLMTFYTPDDGMRLVLLPRYTAMQPQDGSQAILAALEIVREHQNRSHG